MATLVSGRVVLTKKHHQVEDVKKRCNGLILKADRASRYQQVSNNQDTLTPYGRNLFHIGGLFGELFKNRKRGVHHVPRLLRVASASEPRKKTLVGWVI